MKKAVYSSHQVTIYDNSIFTINWISSGDYKTTADGDYCGLCQPCFISCYSSPYLDNIEKLENLHSRKRLEGVLQELSGIIADLQEA